MKLGKLKDGYSKLTSIEIIQQIAEGRICGMWLSKSNKDTAIRRIQDNISEEEASELLDQFDIDRQGAYNHWDMFN